MRVPRWLGPWIQAIGAVVLLLMLASIGLALESSSKPDVRCPQGPTASKTQSKLWFNDGAWWGVFFDGASEEYRIYRHDRTQVTWSNTGTTVDERNASRADVLWEDGHLYVVSAGTEAGLEEHSARFMRYSYDPSSRHYSLDEGFPVKIADGGTEAITVARDTTGKLWATYMSDVGEDLRRVYVTHTQDGDDARWVEPYTPSLPGTTGNTDDLSGIVAFGSQVGLAWSNQNDESGRSGYYFATHDDGEPEDSWRPDNPVLGAEWANDHLNLKTDSKGRVYMTLKTRRDRIDREPEAPYNMLWVRGQEGEWTDHVFGTVGDSHTRAQLLIDEEQRLLYMFASSPTCSGGKVYYKRASLDDISFEEGRGDLFMQSSDGTPIGDSTSTKQNIDGTTKGLVVASNEARDYYYNLIDPRDQQKLFPNGSRIDTEGSGG
jgi:hypothetical protein